MGSVKPGRINPRYSPAVPILSPGARCEVDLLPLDVIDCNRIARRSALLLPYWPGLGSPPFSLAGPVEAAGASWLKSVFRSAPSFSRDVSAPRRFDPRQIAQKARPVQRDETVESCLGRRTTEIHGTSGPGTTEARCAGLLVRSVPLKRHAVFLPWLAVDGKREKQKSKNDKRLGGVLL